MGSDDWVSLFSFFKLLVKPLQCSIVTGNFAWKHIFVFLKADFGGQYGTDETVLAFNKIVGGGSGITSRLSILSKGCESGPQNSTNLELSSSELYCQF